MTTKGLLELAVEVKFYIGQDDFKGAVEVFKNLDGVQTAYLLCSLEMTPSEKQKLMIKLYPVING